VLLAASGLAVSSLALAFLLWACLGTPRGDRPKPPPGIAQHLMGWICCGKANHDECRPGAPLSSGYDSTGRGVTAKVTGNYLVSTEKA